MTKTECCFERTPPERIQDILDHRKHNVTHMHLRYEARRDYLQLCCEIDYLRAERSWQPIATAPKDGTLILGFAIVDTQTGNWKIRIMSHDHYAEVGMGQNWSGWGDSWVGPTHWLPLPAPPADKPTGIPMNEAAKEMIRDERSRAVEQPEEE